MNQTASDALTMLNALGAAVVSVLRQTYLLGCIRLASDSISMASKDDERPAQSQPVLFN